MLKPLIAVLLSLSLSAAAADGKTVSDSVKIGAGRKIRVEMDKGLVVVKSSAAGTLTYRVQFTAERTGWRWFFGSTVPSARDYDASTAAFDAATGVLSVRSGRRVSAVLTVEVPAKQALDLQLAVGDAEIGPRSGKLDAFVGVGELEFDGSALPSGACVETALEAGSVENARDQRCKSVGATLHGRVGSIAVN